MLLINFQLRARNRKIPVPGGFSTRGVFSKRGKRLLRIHAEEEVLVWGPKHIYRFRVSSRVWRSGAQHISVFCARFGR